MQIFCVNKRTENLRMAAGMYYPKIDRMVCAWPEALERRRKMIYLADITPDNWRLGLKVAESQKTYVANSAVLLARAYAYRDYRSRAFVIYNDETPVGMGLYYDCPELNSYDFSQIFIDERYQGCGYGKAAAKLVLDEMKSDGKYDKVVLCYIEGNDAAKRLYEQFGFMETGSDEDEITMEMTLR